MNLINHTPYAADHTTAHDKSGRTHLLVVIKATYRLPLGGEPAQLMAEQLPLVDADTATGTPGLSAPEYECDFVLTKPRCEVLLLGSAYAPRAVPAALVDVGIKVGDLTKMIRVYGQRHWRASALLIRASKPEPFTRQAISYDIAFGGAEHHPKDPDNRAIYLANPIGIGYQKKVKAAWTDGKPMPQTEALNMPITRPNSAYPPMSFGPLGRHWAQRVRYAGTYDAHWQQEICPFLPPDFDERYFQSAPQDQQLDALHGGQAVTLVNLTHPALTPSGRLDFVLPNLSLHATIHLKNGATEQHPLRADTLMLEPDKQRFTVTWRIAHPLRRSPVEIDAIELNHTAPNDNAPAAPCCPAHSETPA
jgi:hypothetical protein